MPTNSHQGNRLPAQAQSLNERPARTKANAGSCHPRSPPASAGAVVAAHSSRPHRMRPRAAALTAAGGPGRSKPSREIPAAHGRLPNLLGSHVAHTPAPGHYFGPGAPVPVLTPLSLEPVHPHPTSSPASQHQAPFSAPTLAALAARPPRPSPAASSTGRRGERAGGRQNARPLRAPQPSGTLTCSAAGGPKRPAPARQPLRSPALSASSRPPAAIQAQHRPRRVPTLLGHAPHGGSANQGPGARAGAELGRSGLEWAGPGGGAPSPAPGLILQPEALCSLPHSARWLLPSCWRRGLEPGPGGGCGPGERPGRRWDPVPCRLGGPPCFQPPPSAPPGSRELHRMW